MTFHYYRNLVPGQFQIGDIVMGKGTNIIVENWDVKPYDVNQQDYQVSQADEMRFGLDSFKPTTIEFSFQVLHNRLLPGNENVLPNFWHSMPTISDLAREWRFDEGRKVWGEMKPIFICSQLDNIPKMIFGRPSQFGVTAMDEFNHGEIVKVLGEFRRGDTLAYSITENAVALDTNNLNTVIHGTQGQGASWIRVLLAGPVVNPVITFTNLYQQSEQVAIQFNYELYEDEVVEINGYPWTRRVVNNDTPPTSLAAYLVGDSPYLDRLRFNFDAEVFIELSGDSMGPKTQALVLWRDSYTVI